MKKDRYSFIAIFNFADDGISISFPDLPGCNTFGSDLRDAFQMAEECLGSYVGACADAGDLLSPPSDIRSVHPDIDSGNDAFVTYVSVDLNDYRRDTKAVKKMVSIPSWLDKLASAADISLSRVLQESLMNRLGVK